MMLIHHDCYRTDVLLRLLELLLFSQLFDLLKVIRTVAREAGVKIADQQLYADGLGAEGSWAGTYAGMLTSNTRVIASGLGGKCTPFAAKSNS
jgi:manganese/iron transport system substrate-binding protein